MKELIEKIEEAQAILNSIHKDVDYSKDRLTYKMMEKMNIDLSAVWRCAMMLKM